MQKQTLALLILIPISATGEKPKANPADFTLTAHVVGSSHIQTGIAQSIEVVLDGQTMQWMASGGYDGVFPLGDYPAKLLPPPKPTNDAIDLTRGYELLLPNGEARDFYLVALGTAVGKTPLFQTPGN